MKVKNHSNYNPEFPETFTWGWLDSITLCNITATIINYINYDLKKDRNLVPGLRTALNIIADTAEINDVG